MDAGTGTYRKELTVFSAILLPYRGREWANEQRLSGALQRGVYIRREALGWLGSVPLK